MASTYLTRTPSSSGNRKTFTFSFWFKRSSLSSNQVIYNQYNSSNGYNSFIGFNSNNTFVIWDYTNAYQLNLRTNRLFRDVNAWYHAVIAVDTTQATASNRAKLYINGVQETSFSPATYPSQNLDLRVNEYQPQQIGVFRYGSTNADFFDGSMSYVAFVDGTAELPTIFGETDSVTGQWKIKTDITPSVAWGTNGFLILKNGNSLTDESTNTNNFTLGGGTLTNTLDCPSNVFATLNPLYNSGGTVTYSNGNNTFTEPDSQWKTTFSTLGASSGKYYAEFKSNGNYTQIGVADYNVTKSGTADYNFASSTVISTQGYGYYNGNGDLYYRGSSTSYGDTYGNGDIIQVGLDCDNNRVFFGKNGVWQNSADPTNSGTGFAMTATNATYVFALAVTSNPCDANFGNGFFGTSAVADNSTATASTPGTFNYDVPTGFQPLSTKGLNA